MCSAFKIFIRHLSCDDHGGYAHIIPEIARVYGSFRTEPKYKILCFHVILTFYERVSCRTMPFGHVVMLCVKAAKLIKQSAFWMHLFPIRYHVLVLIVTNDL